MCPPEALLAGGELFRSLFYPTIIPIICWEPRPLLFHSIILSNDEMIACAHVLPLYSLMRKQGLVQQLHH